MNINMDSVLSKLKNTVSQVAYQVNTSVNTIIPGNIIHREYELIKERCTHGCPRFSWVVYDAIKRDSVSIKASLKDAIGPTLIPSQFNSNDSNLSLQSGDKQLYSVFLFDKSQLDSIPNRSERELVLEHIKVGARQLTRLRHPSILTVHHAMEESRSSLAFVTEHVFGHLGTILKEQSKQISMYKNRAPPNTRDLLDLSSDVGPKDSDYQQDICQLDDVQTKAGLLQVRDGLKFLHNDAKILHRNLCLENIYVDSNNTWKIAGLDFSCQQLTGSEQPSKTIQETNSLTIIEFTPTGSTGPRYPSLKSLPNSISSHVSPNWSCSAPEHSNSDFVYDSSDIYSLGIISCALMASDNNFDLSYEYGLMSDTYKRGIICRELADKLPLSCKSVLPKYVSLNASSRPGLEDYRNLSIFNEEQIQAILDLDSQFAWDRLKKIEFFDRLRDIIPNLSHQVRVNRIAKSLFKESLNFDMLPFVLPNILIISKDSTPTEFKTKIFPNLKSSFAILEPKTVPLLLMDNIAILADRAKLCLGEFRSAAFTLLQYSLRMDQQMQEKALNVMPTVKKFIDDRSMVSLLLPEINRLCHETNTLGIRVLCFECICKMVDTMEGSTVIGHVLPLVYGLPSRETEVVMAAINIVKTIVNESNVGLTKDILADKLLPFIIPLTIVKDLNIQQFDSIWNLMRKLLDRVERDQRELLSRKMQTSSQRSNAFVLNDFKGSKHFDINL